MSLKITLLFLTLVLQSFSQGSICNSLMQASSDTSNTFQTGYLDIEKTNNQQFTEATIPYKKSKMGVANLGIWLAPLYIHKYKAVDYIDFNVVSAKVKEATFNIVLGIDPNAQWSFCHIHYIVSNRFDLKTGFFFVNDKSFLEAKSGTKVIKQPVNQIKYKTEKVSAFVSISGIKIKDKAFSLIISKSSFDISSKTLSIEVKFDKVDSNIELFYISFILSSDRGTFLDSSKKPLFQTLPSDPKKQISQVVGMTGINNQLISSFFKKRLLITGVTVSPQELNTYKKAFEIKQIGVIIENLGTLTRAEQPTQNDSRRLVKIIQKSNLLNICVSSVDCEEGGGEFIRYKNGSTSCVLCSINKTFDTDSELCICKQGFTLIEKSCVCEQPRFYLENFCFTLEEAAMYCSNLSFILDEKNLKCICEKGFIEENSGEGRRKNCVSKCSNQTKFNLLTEKCECPQGLFYIGDKCVRCRLLQIWNQRDGKCECLPGMKKKKSGQCIRCSPFANFNLLTDSCECRSGYVGNGKICRTRSIIFDSGNRL